jgi:hypothetical protein
MKSARGWLKLSGIGARSQRAPYSWEAAMTRARLGFGGIALFCLVLSPAAHADDTLRCGMKLVQVGNTAYDVRSICGIPDWVDQHVESRAVSRPAVVPCRTGRGYGSCTVLLQDAVQVPVEVWTYDFGPRQFIEYLTFEQGRLVNVQSGPYGHKPI